MNYLESLRYLKNNPPDVLGGIKSLFGGSGSLNEERALSVIADDLGTTFEDMVKNKTLNPKLRQRIIKQMGLDKEREARILLREGMASGKKNRFRSYAGQYGEE